MDQMKKHNKLFQAGTKTYRKRENAMFDMTRKEIELNYMGISEDAIFYQGKASRVYKKISNLPASINWIEKGRVTPVVDQAGCGSCWAHSVVGAIEGAYKNDTNELVNLDVSHLINCSTTDGCKGSYPDVAYSHVMHNGIPIVDEEEGNCMFEGRNGIKITNIESIPSGDENQLMQAVAEKGPVSVLICVSEDMFDYGNDVDDDDVFYQENCSANCSTSFPVNHAVLVVGYGVNSKKETYWLVKNSWGKVWGNKVLLIQLSKAKGLVWTKVEH